MQYDIPMNPPKPGPSLNIISIELPKFASDVVPKIGDALGRAGGITVGENTYLVPGDFMEWFVFLTGAGGRDIASFKIYSLSALHSGMDGLQPMVRALARRHLSSELELLGLEIPASLRGSAPKKEDPT